MKSDTKKAHGTKLHLQHIRINTWTFSYNELLKAVHVINSAPKPVLVHCLHGSDRTGAVIAAYRILIEGWSKEEAIRELRYKAFGYHKFYFPNIVKLLSGINVERAQKQLEQFRIQRQ